MGGRGGSSGMGGRGGGGGGSYHSWPDEASGTHTYYGTGQEQYRFFKDTTNFDELINDMTDPQRGDFRDWARGHFMYGQQYRGWDNMDDYDKRMTQLYDDVLDQATLSEGVILTRRSDAQLVLGKGNKKATMDELKALEGQIVTAKGNMSFGAAAQGLTIGQSGKTMEYRLHIPGGTKGAGMWIGDKRINGWGPGQREFMSNRDITFTIGKTTYDARRGVYQTDLYYSGKEAHDYGRSGRV